MSSAFGLKAPADPLPADLTREHRAELVPPVTHRLVANVDAALGKQILEVRNDNGKRTYIITTRRMISGDE